MSDYNVMDLIKLSAEQKPIDFEQAFNDILVDRMQAAVADQKIEVAQKMFNPQYEEDASGSEETDEADSDDYEQEEPELEDQSDGETA